MIATTTCRLMDAAEALFAERGFDAVSVRDIATAADCNLAAVNYHFQGKENLYLEILRRRLGPKREKLLAALAEVEASPVDANRLEMLVRAFVRVHLEDSLTSEGGLQGLKLIAREMGEPQHGALVIVQELVGPVRRRIGSLLTELLPEFDDQTRQMVIGSIVGQFVYFAMHWRHSRPGVPAAAAADSPFMNFTDDLEEYITQVIDHVTRMTLGGIRALQEGGKA